MCEKKISFSHFALLFSSRERISVFCCCKRFFHVQFSSSRQLSVKILSGRVFVFLKNFHVTKVFPQSCDQSIGTVIDTSGLMSHVKSPTAPKRKTSHKENLKMKGSRRNFRFAADTKNKRKWFSRVSVFFFIVSNFYRAAMKRKKEKQTRGARRKIVERGKARKKSWKWSESQREISSVFLSSNDAQKIDVIKSQMARWKAKEKLQTFSLQIHFHQSESLESLLITHSIFHRPISIV